MTKTKLTAVERRILMNQFKIMAALDIDKDSSAHKRFAEIVEEGYEREYYRLFDSLSDPVSEAEGKFVIDVLEMYAQLQRGFDSASDKKGISPKRLVFHGFDGNNATRRMAYARFVREDGKWSDLRVGSDDLNSHGMGDGQYPAMLERYRKLGKNHGLGIDDVKAVLGELAQA